jgi:DNA gyrase subunit A
MLITQQGKILRMDTKDIRPIGRATQGVRLIEIDDKDLVVSLARLVDVASDPDSEDDEDSEPGEDA